MDETEQPKGIIGKLKSISERTDLMIEKPEIEKSKLESMDDFIRNIDDNILKVCEIKSKHKNKKFKLKGKVKSKLKKVSKKRYVGVIILKLNKGIDITYAEYNDGYVYYNGGYHRFSPKNIYMYMDKMPFGIFDEWSMTFFDPSIKYESDTRIGDKVEIQKLIINKANESKIIEKKGFGGAFIWLFILGGIAVLAWIIFANIKKGG